MIWNILILDIIYDVFIWLLKLSTKQSIFQIFVKLNYLQNVNLRKLCAFLYVWYINMCVCCCICCRKCFLYIFPNYNWILSIICDLCINYQITYSIQMKCSFYASVILAFYLSQALLIRFTEKISLTRVEIFQFLLR